MRARVSTLPAVPIRDAQRDFRKVLKIVDRVGFVRLTRNGKARYHIGKEEEESRLLARLRASVREHREGKTKLLRTLAEL